MPLVVMLDKILIGFSLLFVPITAGYLASNFHIITPEKGKAISSCGVIILGPIVMLLSMWNIEFTSGKLALLPVVGALIAFFSLITSLFVANRLKLTKKAGASLAMASSISNIGETFGALLIFVLMGQQGFGLAMLYCLFLMPWVWSVMFFIAVRASGSGDGDLLMFIKYNPGYILPSIAVVCGLLLNVLLPWNPPNVLVSANNYLIPGLSTILLFSVGTRINFSSIGRHRNLIPYFFAIRYIQIPLLSLLLAFIFSFYGFDIREPFRVIFIQSFAPAGVYSIIMTMIFNLDHDVASSLWVSSTLFSLLISPIILTVGNIL